MFEKITPFGRIFIQPKENKMFDVSFEENQTQNNDSSIYGEIHSSQQNYKIISGVKRNNNNKFDNFIIRTLDFNDNIMNELTFDEPKKDFNSVYFLISFQTYDFLIIDGKLFKITRDSIEPFKIKCYFPGRTKDLDIRQLFRDDNLNPKPNVYPFKIGEQMYVILRNLLFKLDENIEEVILEAIDEQLSIFNWSSTYVNGLGIVTFNYKEEDTKMNFFNLVGTKLVKEMLLKSGTIFNPIDHTLKSFDNEIPPMIQSSASFTYDYKLYFIFLLKEPIIKREECCISILGYNFKLSEPVNIIFNLKDENYKYEKSYTMADASQYLLLSDDEIGNKHMTIFNHGKWKIYVPHPPFINFRIKYGYGPIPDCLKFDNFQQLSLNEIMLKIGAPVFYVCQGDFKKERDFVRSGSIAPSRELVFNDTISLIETSSTMTFFEMSSIAWIGIIDLVDFQDLHDKSEIPSHSWKERSEINDFIEISDGESIIADDPGDLWNDISNCPTITNCMGGKWKPFYDLYEQRVRYLALCHIDYLHFINEIPKGEIYNAISPNNESISVGQKLENIPEGWECIGIVGSDIAMSMLCSESHFFNSDDINFRDDINDLNTIDGYFIHDSCFYPSDKKTIIRQAISELITKPLEGGGEKMVKFTGGVASESGFGDGCYAVLTKRTEGKSVIVCSIFI